MHLDSTRTDKSTNEQFLGLDRLRRISLQNDNLCRCLNIPARYVTGYLGDLGVPALPDPMDFSAWFEVYLGNNIQKPGCRR
jgi:hypothetical protein